MKISLAKILVILLGVIVYLNIGYLIAYSFDPMTSKTAMTKAVYRMIDFYDVVGYSKPFADKGDIISAYSSMSLFWPLFVIILWGANLVMVLWNVLVWFFTGGILRWFRWIK